MNLKQLLYAAITGFCIAMPSAIHANEGMMEDILAMRDGDTVLTYGQFKRTVQAAALVGICGYAAFRYHKSIKQSLVRLENGLARVEHTQGKHTSMLADLRTYLQRVVNTQGAHTQQLSAIQKGQNTLLERLESHANLTKEQLEQIFSHNKTVEKTLTGIHQEMGTINQTVGRLGTELNGMRQEMGKQISEISTVGAENTKTLNEILKEVMAHRTEAQQGTNALGQGLNAVYSAVQKRLQNGI